MARRFSRKKRIWTDNPCLSIFSVKSVCHLSLKVEKRNPEVGDLAPLKLRKVGTTADPMENLLMGRKKAPAIPRGPVIWGVESLFSYHFKVDLY
jgi:hypothetical protein